VKEATIPSPLENQFGGRVAAEERGLRFAGTNPQIAKLRAAMSDPSVTGVVHLIEETKTYGSKGFRKRLVVLEQDKGSFTNFVPVEFTRDSCDSVDEINEGDEVEITYRLNGRRWQKDANSEVKFFVNVEATSFKVTGNANPADAMSERVTDPNAAFNEASEEDAPF
jgi:hypothetical protein